MEGSKLQKPSYSESVLSARRLRAGWEFMAMDDPKITTEIVDRSKEHFERLDKLSLHPLDVETRPENFSLRLRMKHVAKWVWASAWMLGIVTISAVIANLPPYYANKLLSNTAKKKKASPELIGTLKVYSSIVMFPLWWIITGLCISWLLLSTSSPIQNLLVKYWLLEPLTKIPPILTFLILLLWCPVSGKLNLTLHTNATRSWRALKRYSRWKDDEIEWNDLRNEQENIAKKITSIGQGLILPGDPEWKNPPTGMDDAKVVSRRC
jgi:hypothetical protein